MNSIAKAIEVFYKELIDKLDSQDDGFKTLDALIRIVGEACDAVCCRIIEAFASEQSEKFFASKERLASRLIVKERGRTKSVLTSRGMVFVPNDVYENRHAGPGEQKYVRPLSMALEVTPHQQISGEYSEKLIKTSLKMSFKQAAEFHGSEVSRQTVINHIHRLGTAGMYRVLAERRTVKAIDVYLDEDHISLQHDPSGRKTAMIPVAVVCEGHYREGKNADGRVRLLNPHYFTDAELKGPHMTRAIAGFIEATYDPDVLVTIRVHGDGASWIQKAFEDDPRVVHVLDGFHLARSVRRFAWQYGPKRFKTIKNRLEKALKSGSKAEFEQIISGLIAELTDPKAIKRCTEHAQYILKHWEAAAARMREGMTGSCTEAQVQHMMSWRMSSIPKSWSRKFVGHFAALRTAAMNGVDICRPTPDELRKDAYIKYFEHAADEAVAGPFDWSIFEHSREQFDKNSGTQHLLRLIELGGHRSKVC